ncbi:MAG: ABC transporter substrate-binding protein [Chloroflexi bacterium]|nr:ABC transporter substrate-binding protein [Chloroflexota bacterium]
MSDFKPPVTVQKKGSASRRLVPLLVLLVIVILTGAAFFLTRDDKKDNKNTDSGKTNVILFLGYIPSVQFAPLYVADDKGYFAEEGININFENSFNESDGVDRLAINDLQFGIISGEQVILARAQAKPLVYVMEWYHNFPVGVVVPADSDIATPADLAGKKVGIPGPFGASYIGLRALLTSVGLTESDITLEPIGFTAPDLMCDHTVEAAVVYVANEPLTISQCYEVRVFDISEYAHLISNGLVTNEDTLRNNPELVRKMIRAIRRGIEDTIADPQAAFDISLKYVTDLPEDQHATQRQVLLNSVELWKSDNIGMTTPDAWVQTQTVLLDTRLLENPLDDLSQAYRTDLLPE